jgi:hypothetical protein
MAPDISRSTFDRNKRYTSVRSQQGRVAIDADWNEQVDIARYRVGTETLDVVGANGAPKDDAGFNITISGNVPVISAGRMYVGGVLCENDADGLHLDAQPDFPGFALPTVAGRYFAYLDTCERTITSLQDPGILEPALGGPDTCTRTRTAWQVNLLNVGAAGSTIGCNDDVTAWDQLVAPSTATLAAQAEPAAASSSPCVIAPTAGYTSLENHLYRVEVHDASVPSFVWSRENGSVVTRWLSADNNTLTVEGLGPDQALGFSNGDLIELTDDTHVLNGTPGILATINSTTATTITVTSPSAAINFANFPRNPMVRRWDSSAAQPVTAGSWVGIENGVQIQFGSPLGTFLNGDHWLIPARTGLGVLWPTDASNNPVFAIASGNEHNYCRLAILDFDGTNWKLVADCQPSFPTLAEIGASVVFSPAMHVTSVVLVDGQIALPNDSGIQASQLANGIGITCDQQVDPASISNATCEVTLHVPYPLGTGVWTVPSGQPAFFGTQPIVLDAITSVSGSVIQWVPSPSWELTGAAPPVFALLGSSWTNPLLVRLRLRGKYIWALGNPSMRLDGASFGVPRSGGTDVGLPSGNSERADDFEMWFWLVPPPAVPTVLSTFAISPATVISGGSSTATVILSAAAPATGASVPLNWTIPVANVANVPTVIMVQPGQTQGSAAITTGGVLVRPVVITATAAFGGVTSAAQTLTINPGGDRPPPPNFLQQQVQPIRNPGLIDNVHEMSAAGEAPAPTPPSRPPSSPAAPQQQPSATPERPQPEAKPPSPQRRGKR